jgi:hypothetical protein
LRKAGVALHVKNDRIAGDGGVDALLDVGHAVSLSGLTLAARHAVDAGEVGTGERRFEPRSRQ